MRKAIRLSPLFHTASDGKVDRRLGTMLCHDKSVSGAQWWYYMGGGGVVPPMHPNRRGAWPGGGCRQAPCYAYVIYMAMCHVAS